MALMGHAAIATRRNFGPHIHREALIKIGGALVLAGEFGDTNTAPPIDCPFTTRALQSKTFKDFEL